MNLSLSNGWGIVRTIIDLIRTMDGPDGGDEDRKFVLVKDPNQSVIRLYEVPLTTFEEEDDAITGTVGTDAGGEGDDE